MCLCVLCISVVCLFVRFVIGILVGGFKVSVCMYVSVVCVLCVCKFALRCC